MRKNYKRVKVEQLNNANDNNIKLDSTFESISN
jgi:hypothetical protein